MAINLAPGPYAEILGFDDEEVAHHAGMLSEETSDNAAFESMTAPALSETARDVLYHFSTKGALRRVE